jgi:hypothetical protein
MGDLQVKPNGLHTGQMRISIDDGYCEWQFDVQLPTTMSIDQVMEKVVNSTGAKRLVGTMRLRTTHEAFGRFR